MIELPENLAIVKGLMLRPQIEVIPTLKNSIGEVTHVKFKVIVNWKDGTSNPEIEYVTDDQFSIQEAKVRPDLILLKMYREINRKLNKKTAEKELQTIVNQELDKEFI